MAQKEGNSRADTSDGVAAKGPSMPERMSSFQGFIRVFRYGEPMDYFLEGIGIIGTIGSGASVALVNLVMGRLLASLGDFTRGATTPSQLMHDVSHLALYFVYIGIARFVFTYMYALLFTYVSFRLTRNIRHAYLRAALSQETGFFDRGDAGSISMQATSNGKLIQSGTGEKLGLFVQSLATFVAAFIIAFISQWKLTLILICIVPTLLGVVGGVAAVDAGVEEGMLKIHAQAANFSESILSSIRTVHAFHLRPRIMTRYDEYLARSRKLGNKKNWLYGIMFGGEYFVIYAGMGLAFWQGMSMILRGEVDNLGTVFTVLFSVIVATISINAVAPHIVIFNRAANAAAELFVLIDRKSEINPFADEGVSPDHIEGTIDIENIKFSYPTRADVQVFENFSLHVPAGQVTALVGPSGSGKSTIIGLLERWYNPTEGSIRLDGRPIAELRLQWLRTNMRLVQQEPVLFNASVFDNISNGLVGTPWENDEPEARRQRVMEAAKLAFAHDFITSLPDGYDTRIGERGGLLSGGQRQRIAIARSIVSDPRVLLLDEATSALDPHAEGIVQKALSRASKDRTTIVIAHKLATIRDADNIVVLDRGVVVEQGRHDDLVARGGTYARLVKAQDLSSSVDKSGQEGQGQLEELGQHQKEKLDTSSDDGSRTGEAAEIADDIEAARTVTRYATTEARQLAELADRERFRIEDQPGLITVIIKLVRHTPELRWWYLFALIICIVCAGAYPGQALLMGSVMDLYGATSSSRGNFVSLMYFVMGLGCFVVYFLIGWSSNVICQVISQRVRHDMFDTILRQDLRFFDRTENMVGAVTSRIDSQAQSIFELMGFNIALVVIAAVNVVACSILSIVISWKLGLVSVFAGLPPIMIAGWARIRVETRMEHNIDKKFSNSASVASETVLSIRTVSSLAIERHILQRYDNELDQAITNSMVPLSLSMVWFSITQSMEYFILALGFWYGSRLLSRQEVSLYSFTVSFMGVFFSGQAVAQLFGYSSSFTKAKSAANYYFWLLGLKPTIRETAENESRGPPDNCTNVEFKNVKFSYPLAADNRVLNGVSVTIEPGTFVAFVGASGCGKSTMISLLERYYDPTSGSIVIDGTAQLTDISPRRYRSHLALVQQEPTLFPGTIRENVAMGLETADIQETRADEKEAHRSKIDDVDQEKQIEAACRAANVWDFVCSLPDGLNTPCAGSSGSQLSGGQKQRIAIARALIRNPRVLLLDEATSALDTASEAIIQKALKESAITGDRITIAVAHRLSTIRDADRICVFYGGRIIETGTHDELIQENGLYSKMCEAQRLDRSA